MALKAGDVVERYVVEEILGQGGTAVVYRVRHRKLGTEHALKVLTWLGAQAEVRLLLEGRVQAGLRHPNIVAVTDVLDVDGGPGLLMEYVPPPALSRWMESNQPDVAEVERIFRAIVSGVNHAHLHGLVHRDLKPSNVLLQPIDDRLVPKVADFGLAKLLTDDPNAQNTRSGLTMGTPQYMAPEQFRDAKTVDRRADLFSLGCILYELVAGKPPFAWSDMIALYNTIMERGYAPLPAGTPAHLVAAVEGCLDPDRETRIGECKVLLAVLDGRPRPSQPTLIPGDALRLLPRVPVTADTLRPVERDTNIPGDGGTAVPARPLETYVDEAPTVHVPAMAEATVEIRRPEPADSATTMLPEGTFQPAPSPAVKRPWWPWAAVAAGIVGAFALWPRPEPQPVAEEPAPVVVVAPPAPPVEEPPAVIEEAPPPPAAVEAPKVEPPAGKKPTRAKEPVATPPPVVEPTAPAPPADPVPVPPPAPTHGTVKVTGDAELVLLVNGADRFPPGRVPPGRYDVQASFPGLTLAKAGSITVAAGDELTLRCMATFTTCSLR